MRPVASASPAEGAPAFLAKLWQLVHEPHSDHLIAWAPGGKSFIIKDQIDFARKLLPLYYKHNNMASFIRQLNMYGFHKVVSVDNGGLKSENEEVQFSHPFFQIGQPQLLQHIKRKIANSSKNNTEDKTILKPELMTKVLLDVKHMKGRQESLDARFTVMKHENEALWREVALLRQKHVKQQQIVNNLIQFLMSLAQPSRNGPLKTGVKRRYQLMINDAAHHNDDDIVNRNTKSPKLDGEAESEEDNEFHLPEMEEEEGPTIHEVAEQDHAGENSANCLLGSDFDPHLITSPGSSIYTAPSPAASATSLGPVDFDINVEDVDDSAMHSLLLNLQSDMNNDNPLYSQTTAAENMDEKSLFNTLDSTPSNSKKSNKTKPVEKRNPYGKKKQTNSTQAFTMNSQPSTTLPINIFDSDETNSQDDSGLLLSGLGESIGKSGLQLDTDEDFNSKLIDEDYFNNMVSGNYNPNITLNPNSTSKKGKSKSKKGKVKDSLLKNIKQEIINPDDDPNNMTLAVLPNDKPTRPVLNRFHSVEDVDDHLHSMQNEIENLRELLLHGGENYTLDANTLLGLFHEEPMFGLSVNPSDLSTDKSKEPPVDDLDGQLISYVPPVNNLGFDDFELDDEINDKLEPVQLESNENESSSLNTPQVQLLEPKFPKDIID